MLRLDSITDTLSHINIPWRSNDYFIMSNIPFPEPKQNIEIRLGYYALVLCIKGEGDELSFNNESIKVEQNCLYAFCPGNVLTPIYKSPNTEVSFLFFTREFLLKNKFMSHTLDDFKFFANSKYNKIILSQEDVSALMQLYNLLDSKKGNSHNMYHVEIIRCLFFTFLYEAQIIYANHNKGNEPHPKRGNELVLKFNELIKAHSTTHHSLKFYADSLFITPKHLISAIKSASGKTPGVLIDEAILEKAKEFLVHSPLSITEIADLLQFTDIATFSRFFKRYTSLSPSAFKKKYQL